MDKSSDKTGAFELDEIYWFTSKRKSYENGVNTYIMTMLIREPCQIVAYAVDKSVNIGQIQKMADTTIRAEKYYTDGGQAYLGVDFINRHERNIRDKSDKHNIEGNNADIRHYITGMRRRSRCFFARKKRKKPCFAYLFMLTINLAWPNYNTVYHILVVDTIPASVISIIFNTDVWTLLNTPIKLAIHYGCGIITCRH